MLLHTIKHPSTVGAKATNATPVRQTATPRICRGSGTPAPQARQRRSNVLQPISANIDSPSLRTPTKPTSLFASPCRQSNRKHGIKSSPFLPRYKSHESDTAASSDEDEVFFGAVSEAELAKAARMRKRRRRTMLDSVKHLELDNIPPKRADYAARVIQSFFKTVMFRVRFERRRKAAVRIQACFRGYTVRQRLLAMHGAANVIQTWWRSRKSAGPRSPPTLSKDADAVFEFKQPDLMNAAATVVPMKPLHDGGGTRTAVQAKLERLRQLREKRQQLEMRLWRGSGSTGETTAAGPTHSILQQQSGVDSSSAAGSARREVRSKLLGLPGSSRVSRTATDGPGQTSTFVPQLNLCRIPRRFRAGGTARKGHNSMTVELDLERTTRLNTARNSGPAVDRATFLKTVLTAFDQSGSPVIPRVARVRWCGTLESSVPTEKSTTKSQSRRKSILKTSFNARSALVDVGNRKCSSVDSMHKATMGTTL